ncbi:MAG: tRNA-dihydrouridine synthase [bacterium]|nr:tRNA-dihydrouridine synthase [bacterium]
MTNFWKTLAKPIMALAPMADVTDPAFRIIIAKYGKPDVMWTEFVSADGLFRGGREALIGDLAFTEGERPIAAQFFTSSPVMMEQAARLALELGFDGVDINMGCPDKGVEKQGAGAALIKNPARAREVLRAAKRGTGGHIPVSVKTRIGYSRNEIETWLPLLLEEEPAAITIHARTRKEKSDVPAHWDVIKRAVLIRDHSRSPTLILGNGDVVDLADARAKALETGADGIMLGRAIFGNPWLWSGRPFYSISLEEKLRVLVEHTKLFEQLLGARKNFAIMKKHYKAYVQGFDGAKELRLRLMEAKDVLEVEHVVEAYLGGEVRVRELLQKVA